MIREVPGHPELREVASHSNRGTWHTVSITSYRNGRTEAECDCPGYYYRRKCAHVQEVMGMDKETIDTALAAIYADVGYVQKRKPLAGSGVSYTYAGEADIIEALRPAMVTHHVTARVLSVRDVIHDVVTVGSKDSRMQRCTLVATVRFTHGPSGTYVDCEAVGEGMDSGDKASNKAMTGALKYALRQTFVLETGNDPDDSRPETEGERRPTWDVGELNELLREAGLKMAALAPVLKAPKITADNYRPLIDTWLRGEEGRTIATLVAAALEQGAE